MAHELRCRVVLVDGPEGPARLPVGGNALGGFGRDLGRGERPAALALRNPPAQLGVPDRLRAAVAIDQRARGREPAQQVRFFRTARAGIGVDRDCVHPQQTIESEDPLHPPQVPARARDAEDLAVGVRSLGRAVCGSEQSGILLHRAFEEAGVRLVPHLEVLDIATIARDHLAHVTLPRRDLAWSGLRTRACVVWPLRMGAGPRGRVREDEQQAHAEPASVLDLEVLLREVNGTRLRLHAVPCIARIPQPVPLGADGRPRVEITLVNAEDRRGRSSVQIAPRDDGDVDLALGDRSPAHVQHSLDEVGAELRQLRPPHQVCAAHGRQGHRHAFLGNNMVGLVADEEVDSRLVRGAREVVHIRSHSHGQAGLEQVDECLGREGKVEEVRPLKSGEDQLVDRPVERGAVDAQDVAAVETELLLGRDAAAEENPVLAP